MDVLTEFVRTLRRLRRDESGVAMMLTLAVVLVLYVLCSGVYAVGETIREKIEMQNACDSAAYSAAVVQADGLSRMAMVNRALSWTYVQLTNMQLDYITYEWLDCIKRRFSDDRRICSEWASHPLLFEICIACDNCRSWFSREGNGWFCGVYGLSTILAGSGSGYVKLNNNNVIPVLNVTDPYRSIEMILSRTKAMREKYREEIPNLKKLINSLNGIFYVLNQRMQTSIKVSVEAILRANLPRKADGNTDVETGSEFLWRMFNTSPQDPYISGGSSGYFSALFNTEADERRFLSMADGRVHEELLPYFASDGEKAGGLDQWFVRSSEAESANSTAKGINPTEHLRDLGICRVYKNANRYGINDSGDLVKYNPMRGHHTGVLVDTAPSCNNKRMNNREQCQSTDDSVALYADYEWRATRHNCLCYPTLSGVRHKATMNFPASGISSVFGFRHCGHLCSCSDSTFGGFNLTAKSHTRNEYRSCYLDGINLALHLTILGAECSSAKSFLRAAPPYGFARIYGDDIEIYDKERYTGEVAMPWVLNSRFNGADGAIVVALARKQKNPWGRLIGMKSGTISCSDGIYQAFNPTDDGKDASYICAFSAGRAAYHYRPSSDARAFGVTELKDREYETRYDAVCDDDNVSILGPLASLKVGCVCGENNAKRYARCWNLCETDWDAVLVPVRFAKINAGKYDSLVDNTVFWVDTIEPGSNLFKAALTTEVGDDGEKDGWHPFYVAGQSVSSQSGSVSDGTFLKMRQPIEVEDMNNRDDEFRRLEWYESPDRTPRSRHGGWFMNNGSEDAAFKLRIL